MTEKEEETIVNPYAPPQAWSGPPRLGPGGQYRREGKLLAFLDGAELPRRCIRTNALVEDGGWRRTRTLVFTPSWVWVLIVVNVLVMAIVAILVRKKGRLTYCMSPETRRSVLVKQLWAWGVFVLGLGLLGAGFGLVDEEYGAAILLGGIPVMFIGLILLMMWSTPLRVVRHADGWFRVRGCSQVFLDSLESTEV